jgi:hypothetical protein
VSEPIERRLHPDQFFAAAGRLQARVAPSPDGTRQYIEVHEPGGPVHIYADPDASMFVTIEDVIADVRRA